MRIKSNFIVIVIPNANVQSCLCIVQSEWVNGWLSAVLYGFMFLIQLKFISEINHFRWFFSNLIYFLLGWLFVDYPLVLGEGGVWGALRWISSEFPKIVQFPLKTIKVWFLTQFGGSKNSDKIIARVSKLFSLSEQFPHWMNRAHRSERTNSFNLRGFFSIINFHCVYC